MERKGIRETVDVIKRINEEAGRSIFELDIYGMVDNSYKDEFEAMKKEFPSYIRYMGMADSSKTTEVLKNYFLLLFPTPVFPDLPESALRYTIPSNSSGIPARLPGAFR